MNVPEAQHLLIATRGRPTLIKLPGSPCDTGELHVAVRKLVPALAELVAVPLRPAARRALGPSRAAWVCTLRRSQGCSEARRLVWGACAALNDRTGRAAA